MGYVRVNGKILYVKDGEHQPSNVAEKPAKKNGKKSK